MARVLFARSGTVLFSDNGKASPTAGNQDALGVLRYLKQSGHEVAILGPAHGDFEAPLFNVDFSGTPYGNTRPEEYMLRINLMMTELRHWNATVCINVTGQCPSTSNPLNPYGSKPLRSAITTNFPVIKACHDLKIPRICILNDPRCLPREQEAAYMPGAVPVAMLSQRSKVSVWKMQRAQRSLRREEVYAACENWWSFGMPYASLDLPRDGIVVLAHSHAQDLRVGGPERAKVWNSVLTSCQDSYDIYGHGWDGNPAWRGCVKHDKVQDVLRKYRCGPMMSLNDSFASGKVREYVLAGCLPRPVSFGRYHYDKDRHYFAEESVARVKRGAWGDLYDREIVAELRIKTTPNFFPLEDAIEKITRGESHCWGGYRFV